MNKKEAFDDLLNIFREFRNTSEVTLPDFLNSDAIEMDFKDTGELLGKILYSEVHNATEADGNIDVRALSIELMAYYCSFRFANPDPRKQFGVHLLLDVFVKFCKKIKWDSKSDTQDVISAAWEFVFAHEANHFDCDLGSVLVENGLSTTFNSGRNSLKGFFCEHEESLGQTRAISALKKRKYAQIIDAIKTIYAGAPDGYGDLNYLYGNVSIGFDEVVSHSVNQECDMNRPAVLIHSILSRKHYSPKTLKVFIHYSSIPVTNVSSLATPTGVKIDPKAEKQLHKLAKKDKTFSKSVEKTKNQLMNNPHHPSLGVCKFQGADGIYEARIDGGARLIFKRNEEGEFVILELGRELYRH